MEDRHRARGELARRKLAGEISLEQFEREWAALHPPPPEEPAMARDYLSLIERYLLSDITADEFQDAYWPMRRAWLGRDVWLTGDHGKVIDSFDTDMDAFSSDPDVAWHEIDEAELRRCATCARDALRTYVEGLNAAPPT